jgi:drug/metabolite transporter (DMT)-like permease
MLRSRSSTFTPRDVVLLLVLAAMWGHSFLFVKIAVEVIPPGWVVAGRLAVGGALLIAICTVRRQRLPRTRRDWLVLTVIGVAGTGVPWFGHAWAQQFLDTGLVAVLNASTPVATLLLALTFRVERIYLARVVGLGIAIVGTLVVIGGEISAGGPVLALVIAVLAPFGYGFGSVLTRQRISGRLAPLPAAATQLVMAAMVFNLAALPVEGVPPLAFDLPLAPALAVLALGVFGTGLAFIIYFTLIARVGATNASMVTYLVPIVGLIAGAVFRGERFGANVFLGAAVLIVGVYLAQKRPPDRPARPAEAIAVSRPPASA